MLKKIIGIFDKNKDYPKFNKGSGADKLSKYIENHTLGELLEKSNKISGQLQDMELAIYANMMNISSSRRRNESEIDGMIFIFAIILYRYENGISDLRTTLVMINDDYDKGLFSETMTVPIMLMNNLYDSMVKADFLYFDKNNLPHIFETMKKIFILGRSIGQFMNPINKNFI